MAISQLDLSSPEILLPEAFQFLFEHGPNVRYKAAYGGRGSAKSHSFASALMTIAAHKPARVLCAREIQKSIRDSVYWRWQADGRRYRWVKNDARSLPWRLSGCASWYCRLRRQRGLTRCPRRTISSATSRRPPHPNSPNCSARMKADETTH